MSFLVAVLLGALLLGERLGPPSEMRRRFYQVALGITLFLFGLAITKLAFPGPDASAEEILGFGGDSDNSFVKPAAESLREGATFVLVAGLGLSLAGLFKGKEWPTSHLALILSGLLLLAYGLSNTLENDPSIYSLSSSYLVSEAGPERNAIYAIVLGVGALCLFLYGFNHWDKVQVEAENFNA